MNLFLSVFPSLFLFAAFPAGKNGKKTRVRVRQRAADCVPRWLGKSFLCDASPAMSSSFPDAGGLGCFVLFCVGEAAVRAGTYGPGWQSVFPSFCTPYFGGAGLVGNLLCEVCRYGVVFTRRYRATAQRYGVFATLSIRHCDDDSPATCIATH